MNKLLRYLFVALLATFAGFASAEEVTMKYTGTTTSNMTGNNDAALFGLDATAWSVVGSKGGGTNFPGLNQAGDFRLYYNANGSSTVTVSSLTGKLVKTIKLTFTGTSYNNVSVTVDGSKVDANEGVYTINNSSFILGNANTGNTQVRIKDVVIEYTAGGGEVKALTNVELSGDYITRFTTGKDGDETPLPTATVKSGSATVEGAEAKWSLGMGDNWVIGEEEPSIGDGKVYIPQHSYGDLILTARYAGDATYEAGSKSYTLKVYKGYMNIQDVLEQFPEVGGGSWATKEAEWSKGYQASYWQVDMPEGGAPKGKDALVTYVNGAYVYIRDDYGSLLLYGGGLGFKKGDIISGDLGNDKGYGGIYGTLKSYNGLLELVVAKKADAEFVVKSSGNTVEPKTISVDELNQSNVSEFLRIERAVFVGADKQNQKKLTFMVDKKEFLVFNQWGVNVAALTAGKEYTLEGMGSMEYKEGELSNRLNLISFEEAGNVEKVKSFKLTINHDGEVFTESFPASDWQNIVIEGSTTSIKILKAEVEVGIPMKYVGFVATMFNTEDGWQHDDSAWRTVDFVKQDDGTWVIDMGEGQELVDSEWIGKGKTKTFEFFIYAEDEAGTPMHYKNGEDNYRVTFTTSSDDDPNAIGNVNAKPSTLNSQLYNTSGQPVTRTYRGVVIQNAKKVIR